MTLPPSQTPDPPSVDAEKPSEPPRSTNTLADFLREILEHRKANPDHGTNCACMDKICREMKEQLREVIPNPGQLTVRDNMRELEALWSLNHIFGMIIRWFR